MPVGILATEWLNTNSVRSYPLADFATATDTTGSFQLPQSFLLELYFPVHAGLLVDPAKFYLRKIIAFGSGYAVSLGYDDGSGDPLIVATAVVPRNGHYENRSYSMPGLGVFNDTIGKITVGILSEIDQQPPGEFFFNFADGALDTDCIRPIIRGVSAIVVTSGGVTSDPIIGAIELTAGANIALTILGGNPVQIRIDAISGVGLNASCECDDVSQLPPPIRTINGVPPDTKGNVNLIGDGKCLQVTPFVSTITLKDTCSAPCCGSTELNALWAELDHMRTEAANLDSFANRLRGSLDSFSNVVLASRLSDNPCVFPV